MTRATFRCLLVSTVDHRTSMYDGQLKFGNVNIVVLPVISTTTLASAGSFGRSQKLEVESVSKFKRILRRF